MESSIEYLLRKHKTLVNGYRTPNGKRMEICQALAVEVGERLLAEGKAPEIRRLNADYAKNTPASSHGLIPVMFKNKWREGWISHQVCCEGGLVYDPLLGKPVEIKDYSMLMFGRDISLDELIRTDEFAGFARRYREAFG